MVIIRVGREEILISDGWNTNHTINRSKDLEYNEIIIKKIESLDSDFLYFDINDDTNIELTIIGRINCLQCGHNKIFGNWGGGLSSNKIGLILESPNYCRFLKLVNIREEKKKVCFTPIMVSSSEKGILYQKCLYENLYSNEWRECERLRYI